MREKVITTEMSANVTLCKVITLEIYRVGTTLQYKLHITCNALEIIIYRNLL